MELEHFSELSFGMTFVEKHVCHTCLSFNLMKPDAQKAFRKVKQVINGRVSKHPYILQIFMVQVWLISCKLLQICMFCLSKGEKNIKKYKI